MISNVQPHKERTHSTSWPPYAPSALMMRSRTKSKVALASTHLAPSRSWMLAGRTTQHRTSPSVSTSKCRFRPLTFFSRVEAAFATSISRLYRLAVDSRNAGLLVSPGLLANLFPQPCVHGFPSAEEVVDRLPRRKVVRQHAPGTAGPCNVEHGVENIAHVVFSRSASRLGGWNEWFDAFPLGIGQVGGIGLPCHEGGVP